MTAFILCKSCRDYRQHTHVGYNSYGNSPSFFDCHSVYACTSCGTPRVYGNGKRGEEQDYITDWSWLPLYPPGHPSWIVDVVRESQFPLSA